MLKRDKELTAAQGYKDPRSFIAYWNHPGTHHRCEYLKGEFDVGRRRRQIIHRAHGNCEECGRFCLTSGQLHHILGGRGNQRCWCEENLLWLCAGCHSSKHVQVRWTRKRKAEQEFLAMTDQKG